MRLQLLEDLWRSGQLLADLVRQLVQRALKKLLLAGGIGLDLRLAILFDIKYRRIDADACSPNF